MERSAPNGAPGSIRAGARPEGLTVEGSRAVIEPGKLEGDTHWGEWMPPHATLDWGNLRVARTN